jgi:hypothetical protein
LAIAEELDPLENGKERKFLWRGQETTVTQELIKIKASLSRQLMETTRWWNDAKQTIDQMKNGSRRTLRATWANNIF